MLLLVPVDRPTLSEAVALARGVGDMGVGLVAGSLLLSVAGGGAVAALASFGQVMADARLSGGGVVAAARHLAAAGARRVTVDGRASRRVIESVVDTLQPHGAAAVVVALPPEADAETVEWSTLGSGRGRVVSRCAAALDGLDVEFLGVAADAGVVAQVAPAAGLVAWGLRSAEEVADAARRGARAGMVDSSMVDERDPRGALEPLVRAAASG